MKVGMSCDHRVIVGAGSAEYLAELKKHRKSGKHAYLDF